MIAFMVLGTTGVYYGLNLTYVLGQEDSEESNSGDEQNNSGEEPGTDTVSNEGVLTYVDPQGRFSIAYPPDAVITPLEGIPGGVVSISSPLTSIDVRLRDQDTDVDLEDHVSSILAGLENSSIPNFKRVQNAECEKYSLAGEQACSIIYNGDIKRMSGVTLNNATVMQIYSVLDSSLYNIAYSAPDDVFNNNLKILEPMLNSFETLNDQEDLTPIPRFHNLTSQQTGFPS